MWPTYKPISWDKYYAHNFQDKHTSITSGLAAGITVGVFFTVFLLTFGCRLYSRRAAAVDTERRHSADRRARLRRRPSVSQLYPPPPYELAIQMPKPLEWAPPAGGCGHPHAFFEPPPSFNELPVFEAPAYSTTGPDDGDAAPKPSDNSILLSSGATNLSREDSGSSVGSAGSASRLARSPRLPRSSSSSSDSLSSSDSNEEPARSIDDDRPSTSGVTVAAPTVAGPSTSLPV